MDGGLLKYKVKPLSEKSIKQSTNLNIDGPDGGRKRIGRVGIERVRVRLEEIAFLGGGVLLLGLRGIVDKEPSQQMIDDFFPIDPIPLLLISLLLLLATLPR